MTAEPGALVRAGRRYAGSSDQAARASWKPTPDPSTHCTPSVALRQV